MTGMNFKAQDERRTIRSFLKAVMGTSIIFAFSIPQAMAGPHDAVTNTGQELAPSTNFTPVVMEPFGGAQGPKDLLENAGMAERLSDEEWQRLLALEPTVSPAVKGDKIGFGEDVLESVIGPDDRTRNYTTTYPASAVVLIEYEGARCTGFMISADTVATAGHCLHTGDAGGYFDINSFRIRPGFDGVNAHFGECGARQLFTVTGWVAGGDSRYDYGAIKLDCTVGNQTGWFGLRTDANNREPVVVTGYPGDKPLEQWQATDQVRRLETRRLYYAADTFGGNSGGPAWNNYTGQNGVSGPYVIAVHSNGVRNPGLADSYNSGTRIVEEVLANFVDWIDLP